MRQGPEALRPGDMCGACGTHAPCSGSCRHQDEGARAGRVAAAGRGDRAQRRIPCQPHDRTSLRLVPRGCLGQQPRRVAVDAGRHSNSRIPQRLQGASQYPLEPIGGNAAGANAFVRIRADSSEVGDTMAGTADDVTAAVRVNRRHRRAEPRRPVPPPIPFTRVDADCCAVAPPCQPGLAAVRWRSLAEGVRPRKGADRPPRRSARS